MIKQLVEDACLLYTYEREQCYCSACNTPPCAGCENSIDEESLAECIRKDLKEIPQLSYFTNIVEAIECIILFDNHWHPNGPDIRQQLVDLDACVEQDGLIMLSEEIVYALDF